MQLAQSVATREKPLGFRFHARRGDHIMIHITLLLRNRSVHELLQQLVLTTQVVNSRHLADT
jgi:hypothetical protein